MTEARMTEARILESGNRLAIEARMTEARILESGNRLATEARMTEARILESGNRLATEPRMTETRILESRGTHSRRQRHACLDSQTWPSTRRPNAILGLVDRRAELLLPPPVS